MSFLFQFSQPSVAGQLFRSRFRHHTITFTYDMEVKCAELGCFKGENTTNYVSPNAVEGNIQCKEIAASLPRGVSGSVTDDTSRQLSPGGFSALILLAGWHERHPATTVSDILRRSVSDPKHYSDGILDIHMWDCNVPLLRVKTNSNNFCLDKHNIKQCTDICTAEQDEVKIKNLTQWSDLSTVHKYLHII